MEWPPTAEVFLTVPRWFGGVPSTLNKITIDLTKPVLLENAVLEPYPSWDMQEVGNCDKLQYVQSMEIDVYGYMWVIDTGRVNIFTENPDNTCPPKLLVIDTKTGSLVDEPYIFPNEVAPHNSTFLNDIALDNVNCVAYISDMTGVDADGNAGGLIVYNRYLRKSARFYHESMAPEMGLSWNYMGRNLGNNAFVASINGVAVTPDGSRVFYSPLQGLTLYSVDAGALRDNSDTWVSTIVNHGKRQGSTDGMTMDCAGNIFYSDLNSARFYKWDTASDHSPIESGVQVAQDMDKMWWTDTYAWDDAGYLWYTADFVPSLFSDGAFLKVNIFRISQETEGYQSGSCSQVKSGEYNDVLDAVSPATVYPNVPEHCRGKVPGMLGEYRFFGFRLQGEPAADMTHLASWTEGVSKREIAGIEWVPWVDGPYYLLAINSPAGLVRRFCAFDAKDNRTSVCTGMDERDETATETLYVTETDELCRANSFSIITTKAFTKGDVATGETAVANMFVDKVEGVRTSYDYPQTPQDVRAGCYVHILEEEKTKQTHL